MRRARTRVSALLLISALSVALPASFLVTGTMAAAGVNLSFTLSPPSASKAGANFPVQVHVQDDAANALSGATVTLDIDPGHNAGNGTLVCPGGNAMSTNVAGDAIFTSCHVNRVGSGYALRAQVPGATTITSVAFDIEAGPAAALAFSSYPASTTAPLLNPQPTVRIVDAGGNKVAADTRTITLSINKHAGSLTCAGGLSKTTVDGVASFTGCRQTALADDYQLTASANGLTPVTGSPFSVAAGASTAIELCWGSALPCSTTPPVTAASGRSFEVQPVVRIIDPNGNTISTDDSTKVTLALTSGTPDAGGPGTLTCTDGLTKTVTDGVARFSGCRLNRAGTGYRLHVVSTPALVPTDSDAFNVYIGPPTKLAFLSGVPTSVKVGATFGPIEVAIEDAGDDVVTSGIQATVQLGLGTNPGGGPLTCAGGLNEQTVNGIATFTGCSIATGATGYRLSARDTATSPPTNLTNATSDAFGVGGADVSLLLTSTPTSGVIVWGQTALLNVQFSVVGARQAVLEASRDRTTWTTIGTFTTDAKGAASFSYRPSDNRYYRAVFAGSPDLPPATSDTIRIVVRQTNALRPTTGGGVRHLAAGATVRFSSTVRPNRSDLPTPHVQFVIYRLVGHSWKLIQTQTVAADASGVARLDVTVGSAASYYVRSQALPTTLNANSGWSAIERYDAQ